MTPEELRGKVADELRRIDPATYEQDAAAAIRVVLEAVAADLDERAARPHAFGPPQRTGIFYAAAHIRSMMGGPK